MGAILPEVHRQVLAGIPMDKASAIARLAGTETLDPDDLERRGAGLADIVLVLSRANTKEADELIEIIIGRPIHRGEAGPAMGDLPRPRRTSESRPRQASGGASPVAGGGRRLARVGENPHRPGSARALAFDRYAVGMTEDEVRRAVPSRYIERHEADGLIEWEKTP